MIAASTPGPWEFIDATKSAKYQFALTCVIRAGAKQIASFSWNDNSPYFPTKAESQANARLIAAAPELLGALKDIVRRARKDFGPGPEGDRRHRAAYAEQFAAIAKAEGGAS